jgi:RNA polymerase sigma-70 factor, ECF subfamily
MMGTLAPAEVPIAVRGEEGEFTQLFHSHKRKAFHFAFQLTGNREDAMDLTQEAFLRVHRHWSRRDPSRPFTAWLYSILRNLAIDLKRQRDSRTNREQAVAVEDGSTPNPEHLARQTQLKTRVWDAINQLPDQQREVLVLRDIHGLSYAEIAQVTGATLATVNSRLHDARQKLRQKLGRCL